MDHWDVTAMDSAESWDDGVAPWLRLFSEDTQAPLQFLDANKRHTHHEPEKKLMLALLNDAIFCFQHYFGARKRSAKKLFIAAEKWIFQTRNDDLFSFESVCEHLGINPGYLRKGLRRWKMNSLNASLESAEKSLPNSPSLHDSRTVSPLQWRNQASAA